MDRPKSGSDQSVEAAPITNPASEESAALLAHRASNGEKAKPSTPDFLTLTNPYEKPSAAEPSGQEGSALNDRGIENTGSAGERISVDETDSPSTPRRWTMAIDLTASGNVEFQGERRPTGADNKLQQILDLAERTRDKPVTIYVQAALPLPETVREDGSIMTNRNDQQVATYRLEDGQIKLVDQGKSQGFQQNLENLLQRASQRAGQGNLGLMIQSHGFAANGLGGDTGEASLEELEQTIRNGLRASGREALDILNFDSCSMGNLNVAQAMQGEARHVIASAEVERSLNDADGQNVRTTLGAILDQPQMSARDYADRSIALARQGHNDDTGNLNPEASGTDTLAHFDLSRYPQMERALDGLAEKLTTAARLPQNRQALVQIIDGVSPFGNEGARGTGAFGPSRRDLGLFLNALEQGLNENKISDADGSLRQALEASRGALGDLVRDYHGENYNRYNEMAGVSVFLPGSDILNLDAHIAANSPLTDMLTSSAPGSKFARFQNRENLAESLNRSLQEMENLGDTRELSRSVENLAGAGNEAEFDQSLAQLQEGLQRMQAGPLGRAIIASQRQEMQERLDRLFEQQLNRLPSNWQNFLNTLKS